MYSIYDMGTDIKKTETLFLLESSFRVKAPGTNVHSHVFYSKLSFHSVPSDLHLRAFTRYEITAELQLILEVIKTCCYCFMVAKDTHTIGIHRIVCSFVHT